MTVFEERLAETTKTLAALATDLRGQLGADGDRILREDTCVYVVGSGGRGEMSADSDVDLFVARVSRDPSDVDSFALREAIARSFFALKLPDPSQGGDFLKMHTARTLCGQLGTPADDASNTFTARMLLLLESHPLVGEKAYESLLDKVVEAYWGDAEAHQEHYQPFTLVNDVVRYWRILLLNYVAKLAKKESELTDEDLRAADRRLRSYKLRFSRCMTCFSFLTALVALSSRGAVKREDVVALVRMRPVERLRGVAERRSDVEERVASLLDGYDGFLTQIAAGKDDLRNGLRDEAFRSARSAEARRFGDEMFELLLALGKQGEERGRELLRHIVV